MAKVLPKEQRAILAAHEGGAHDGPPYGKPRPDICPACRDDKSGATEVTKIVTRKMAKLLAEPQPTLLAPADLDPKPPKARKAKTMLADKVKAKIIEVKPVVGQVIELPGITLLSTAEDIPLAPTSTREGWMLQAVEVMRRWFPEDQPVPEVRVSIGWPAGRGTSRAIGQCFYTTADHAPALFVAPSLSNVGEILETLLHEAVHAAVGSGVGHKGAFVKLAKELGFTKPWRSTPATPELKDRLHALAESLGDFPHAKVAKSADGRPSVQGTRMLKIECRECGCILRMTQTWIDTAGLPTCGCGETMEQAA